MDTSQNQFLTQHTENGVIVLTFTESTLNAGAVMEALNVINATENRKVILDFQSIRFLVGGSLCPDQEPFTPLLKLNKQLERKGGRLVLCNFAPDVADVFRIIRIDRLIEVQLDINAAMECLDKPKKTKIPGYKHVQHAPLCLLLYVLAVVFVVLGWVLENEQPFPWLFPPIGLLLLILAASFHHLTVEDQVDRLSVSFGPIRLFRRSIRYDDIISAEIGRTTILDGWGIHMSLRGGWVWNIWGRDCVVLRLRKGILRVGTDDADQLLEFLNSRLSEQEPTSRGR